MHELLQPLSPSSLPLLLLSHSLTSSILGAPFQGRFVPLPTGVCRMYVVHKAGSLAKSKGGSMMPAGKCHSHWFPWCGIANFLVFTGLILVLLFFVIIYPVLTFYRDEKQNNMIQGNLICRWDLFSFSLFMISFFAEPAPFFSRCQNQWTMPCQKKGLPRQYKLVFFRWVWGWWENILA